MGVAQGRSQPHSSGWARVLLSSFFPQIQLIFLIFPQTLLIFFLILALPVGESSTREGPGNATGVATTSVVRYVKKQNKTKQKTKQNKKTDMG